MTRKTNLPQAGMISVDLNVRFDEDGDVYLEIVGEPSVQMVTANLEQLTDRGIYNAENLSVQIRDKMREVVARRPNRKNK